MTADENNGLSRQIIIALLKEIAQLSGHLTLEEAKQLIYSGIIIHQLYKTLLNLMGSHNMRNVANAQHNITLCDGVW